MTVLVGAMQADSRGSVVGRGRGDCSCLTVSSYRGRPDDADLLLSDGSSHVNPAEVHHVHVYECVLYAYLLALLQKEQKLHANRGDPSSLGPMKAAVGEEDPQQGLVLPQPRLAPLRVLLLGLEATSFHLVTFVGPDV